MAEELGHQGQVDGCWQDNDEYAGACSCRPRKNQVEMIYEWDKPFIVDSSKPEKTFG